MYRFIPTYTKCGPTNCRSGISIIQNDSNILVNVLIKSRFQLPLKESEILLLIIYIQCHKNVNAIYTTGAGTGTNQPKCPLGTYSNQTGLDEEADCWDCTPGYYCASEGLVEPTGPCTAGKISPFFS